ncbi:g524 [Coccomyxa elongata]
MKLSALLVAVLLCAPLQLMARTTDQAEGHVDVPHRPGITFAFPTFLELDDVLESAPKDTRHRKALRAREGFHHHR